MALLDSDAALDEEVARILSHTPTFGERAMVSHTASPEDPEVWLPPSRQPSFTRTPAASDDEGGSRLALRRPFSSEAGLYFCPDSINLFHQICLLASASCPSSCMFNPLACGLLSKSTTDVAQLIWLHAC